MSTAGRFRCSEKFSNAIEISELSKELSKFSNRNPKQASNLIQADEQLTREPFYLSVLTMSWK